MNDYNQHQEPVMKIFEVFPFLMPYKIDQKKSIPQITKEMRRMRELVILNKNGTVSIASEGIFDENGSLTYYLAKYETDWGSISDLCKFIRVPQRELISLN